MANEIIIGQGVNVLGILVRAYNLSNVRVPDVRDNPYNAVDVQAGYVAPDATRSASLYPENKGGYLGVPVFTDLTLQGSFYTDNITGEQITFPDITFDAVLCTVDFVSRIVKTEIQGRDGTVKEYIGEDDARVTIQGVITGANGVYPQNEVNLLNQWRKAPISKGAVCGFLQNLGISNLVVESFNLPQILGGYSYQTFTMNCISDIPVELVL
jgi:hypothetical protein